MSGLRSHPRGVLVLLALVLVVGGASLALQRDHTASGGAKGNASSAGKDVRLTGGPAPGEGDVAWPVPPAEAALARQVASGPDDGPMLRFHRYETRRSNAAAP